MTAPRTGDAPEQLLTAQPDEVFTLEQAAAFLRVSERFVQYEVQAERLKCRRAGRKPLFLRRWLVEWMEHPGGAAP